MLFGPLGGTLPFSAANSARSCSISAVFSFRCLLGEVISSDVVLVTPGIGLLERPRELAPEETSFGGSSLEDNLVPFLLDLVGLSTSSPFSTAPLSSVRLDLGLGLFEVVLFVLLERLVELDRFALSSFGASTEASLSAVVFVFFLIFFLSGDFGEPITLSTSVFSVLELVSSADVDFFLIFRVGDFNSGTTSLASDLLASDVVLLRDLELFEGLANLLWLDVDMFPYFCCMQNWVDSCWWPQ